MSESEFITGKLGESVSPASLERHLQQALNGKDVLGVYLRLEKMNGVDPLDQEKVATRLLEFGETDKAMQFIEMAERRRADETLVREQVRSFGLEMVQTKMTDIPRHLEAISQNIVDR